MNAPREAPLAPSMPTPSMPTPSMPTPSMPTPSTPALPTPWACAYGDDVWGLWAEFEVSGVRQRLRWIEPGTFMMGSPDDEPERSVDEGPRHAVHISRGFWLADTACTQALWLAVMGEPNPSRFNDDPQNPVEQVSWDDVCDSRPAGAGRDGFLERLRQRLPPGSDPALPTEAQWEYACRAGSDTPFAFGRTVTTDRVNYDGNHPYPGATKGPYRQRTVAVKALPANRWGLYQMHGNVWEWCADRPRTYRALPKGAVAVVDPGLDDVLQADDQQRSAHRAVRGGSWFIDAGRARSAYRDALGRSARHADLGFRLALRS